MLTCVQHPDDAIIRYVNEPDQFETPNCYFGYGLKGKVPFMGLVSAVSFIDGHLCLCPCLSHAHAHAHADVQSLHADAGASMQSVQLTSV